VDAALGSTGLLLLYKITPNSIPSTLFAT